MGSDHRVQHLGLISAFDEWETVMNAMSRKKKLRSHDQDEDSPPVPENQVPEKFIRDGLFNTTGYKCNQCEFRTDRGGFRGKQSLRAHLKRHRRERRARWRPMLLQIVMAAVAAVLALAPVQYVTGDRLHLPVAVSSVSLGMAISATTTILFILMWVTTSKAAESLDRTWLSAARVVLWLADGSVLVAGVISGDMLGVAIEPYWAVGPAALLCLAVLAAPALGEAELWAARGEFRSGRYRRLLSPRDEDAEDRYWSWLTGVRNAVRDGRLNLRDLKGEGKKLAQALGLERIVPKTGVNRPSPPRS